MTNLVRQQAKQLRAIAKRRSVRRLAVFGSALTEEFDPTRSDIDLLVEFDPLPPVDRADAYFGLLADLEALFGRPVDFVERSALRNPIVRETLNRARSSSMTQCEVRAYLLDIEQACAPLARFTSDKTLADYLSDPMVRSLLGGSSRSSAKRSTARSLSIRG